jgi:hypothetical protein
MVGSLSQSANFLLRSLHIDSGCTMTLIDKDFLRKRLLDIQIQQCPVLVPAMRTRCSEQLASPSVLNFL